MYKCKYGRQILSTSAAPYCPDAIDPVPFCYFSHPKPNANDIQYTNTCHPRYHLCPSDELLPQFSITGVYQMDADATS